MTIKTRKPTGKPSWPITLVAGAEKTGKSYSAALAAASDLIGDTYWVGIGEDQPDEYGLLADFNIVEHEGTYRDILNSITEIGKLPKRGDGRQILLVVDSMTRLWDLLSDNAQQTANRRALAKARKYNKPEPEGDVQITMDLWNTAKQQWNHIMDAIRSHQGPSILTARLENVTVMDDKGQPTTQKQAKVKAEKSLPYDVGAVIEMPARGETYISGVRSVRLQLAERTRVPDFTMDTFWRKLGLHDTETADRTHDAPKLDDEPEDESGRDWLKELSETEGDLDLITSLGAAARAANAGETILGLITTEWRAAKEAAVAPPEER